MNAELLAAYIAKNYSHQQLAYIRLLSSFDYFTENTDNLQLFVEKEMISFEKGLKIQNGIWYTAGKFERFQIHENGTTKSYRDDALSTVYRLHVDKIYEDHPDLHCFPRLPVCHNFAGERIEKIWNGFDYGALAELCRKPEFVDLFDVREQAERFLTWFDTETKTPLTRLHIIEAAGDLVLKVRKVGDKPLTCIDQTVCPLAKPEELGAVLMGFLPRSIQYPPVMSEFHKQQIIGLKLAYPNSELVGNVFQVKTSVTFFEHLGLPSNDELLSSDDSCSNPKPVSEVVVSSTAQISSVAKEQDDLNDLCEKYVDAINHVVAYRNKDLNSLSVAAREVALYGTQEGKKIWEELSAGFIKGKWNKVVPAGIPHHPGQVIDMLTHAIGNQVEGDRKVMELLAAGRLVSAKGSWEFKNMWMKK